MNFELFVGLRYLKAKRTNKFVSIISVISIVGVAVGVMTLIAVLSVMNGFQLTIRDKIINTGFHIYATSWGADGLLNNYETSLKKIREDKGIVYATPFFKSQVIVKSSPQRFIGVDLFGVEPSLNNKDVSFGNTVKIENGNFDIDVENSIIIGSELAKFLGVAVGDHIEIVAPTGNSGKYQGMIAPAIKRYNITGIFKIGYYEYDLKMAFISLGSAQALFNKPGHIWGIGMRIKDIFSASYVASEIKRSLNFRYQIFTWMDFNRNLFTALKNEKVMMAFIVFLIIMVAAFNIASTLIMIVMEKKKEIGILKAMGANADQISSIFLVEGGITGILGTLAGFVFGILISKNLEAIFAGIENIVNFFKTAGFVLFGKLLNLAPPIPFKVLSEEVYYFDKLPVVINYGDVLIICIVAIFISIVFSIIPAWQASKLNPVDAIRYE